MVGENPLETKDKQCFIRQSEGEVVQLYYAPYIMSHDITTGFSPKIYHPLNPD